LVQPQQQQQQMQQEQPQQQISTIIGNTSMYEFIEKQQVYQKAVPPQQQVEIPSEQNSMKASVKSYRGVDIHYTSLSPEESKAQETQWDDEGAETGWNTSRNQICTPRG
jgi:hypothetical protein